MYGLRFQDKGNKKGGELVYKKQIGEPECRRRIDCSLFDQGK